MFGGFVSYWQLPVIAAAAWFGTLLAMMIVWLAKGQPHYVSMEATQHIAYISDIGASGLKPLFIAGSAVSVIVFDVAFISERWLRHKGRLAHNTHTSQKIVSGFAIAFAIIGAAGLILLSIFDTRRYPNVHDAMLGVFIGGYVISAVFICAEYQRLGVQWRGSYSILAISFWVKLVFIIVEIALAIAFGVMQKQSHWNRAAILEWVIALIYIFYNLSFVMDFIPAIKSKHNLFPTVEEMAMANENGPSVSGGPVFTEDSAAKKAYRKGHPNAGLMREQEQGELQAPNATFAGNGNGNGYGHDGSTIGRDSYSSQQPMMYPASGAQDQQELPTRNF